MVLSGRLTKRTAVSFVNIINKRGIFKHNDTGTNVFEPYEPGVGYVGDGSPFFHLPSKKEFFKTIDIFKRECKLWIQDVKSKNKSNMIFDYKPEEIHKVFTFEKEENLEKWACSSDSTQNNGFSKCSLVRNNSGHAIFSGNLDTTVPKDGKSHRSGFCAIRSPRAMKPFFRKSYYDWNQYTHLVIRVRGDGRTYLLNLSNDGRSDMTWFNLYTYALYTRGGPYWQTSKIPFSKFIFGYKGHIQDKQYPIVQDLISYFGISLCDQINGPFHLEIDYVGLELDGRHVEEHAYELYELDKWIGD